MLVGSRGPWLIVIVQDSYEIWTSGLLVWPAVSLISFIAVPAEKRVLFGSMVGVAWGVYLSLLASR